MSNTLDDFLSPWEIVSFMFSCVDRFQYGSWRGQKQEVFINQFFHDIERALTWDMVLTMFEEANPNAVSAAASVM